MVPHSSRDYIPIFSVLEMADVNVSLRIGNLRIRHILCMAMPPGIVSTQPLSHPSLAPAL